MLNPPGLPHRTENGARSRYRRVIMTTCQAHGAARFTNLLLAKEDGVIVLSPHLADCCVPRLDEQAASAVHSILGEWLRWPKSMLCSARLHQRADVIRRGQPHLVRVAPISAEEYHRAAAGPTARGTDHDHAQ